MRIASCIAAAVAAASVSASAVEMNYTWKKGDVHRFRYEDDTTFEMKMGGGMPGMGAMGGMMGMPAMGGGDGTGMRVQVRSEFAQKVLAVRPDGTADVELAIEKMELVQGGRGLNVLDKVPPAARVVKAEIDRKGHAKFYRMITLYVQEEQVLVGVSGSVQAGPHGGRATATAGGQQVELVASIDPRTGAITASASVKDAPEAKKKTTTKAVQVKEEDPGVDVLPKQILEMMALPDGDLSPGDAVTVKTPMGDIEMRVPQMKGAVAQLDVTMKGKEVTADEKGMASDGEPMGGMIGYDMGGETGDDQADGMPGMDTGGMGTGGMGMGGMAGTGPATAKGKGKTKSAAAEGPTAGMKMDLAVSGSFDTAAGKLLGLEGSMAQDMSMGGMGVKTKSKFKLVRK